MGKSQSQISAHFAPHPLRLLLYQNYAMVQKKETDLHDPKSIIKTMLRHEGTQMAMTQQDSWMEMITESNALWEREVQYGQFQPINKQETEQEKRKRRNNTFGMELPKDFIREHGGKRKLIQIIRVRHKIEE